MGPRRRSVAWADAARQRLDEALAYVAQDSPSAAAQLLERLLKASASLEILAERGRIVPEKPDESIRELLVNPYRLVYQLRHAEVIVVALLHQRQDFARWTERDPQRPDAP